MVILNILVLHVLYKNSIAPKLFESRKAICLFFWFGIHIKIMVL